MPQAKKDPKQRFKQYVGKESGGSRPEGKGFITEKQRNALQPAHLDYLVERNKKKNHFPKRVSDEQWAEAKKKLQQKHKKPDVQGNNKQGKTKQKSNKAASASTSGKNTAVPSAKPPTSRTRKSTRKTSKPVKYS